MLPLSSIIVLSPIHWWPSYGHPGGWLQVRNSLLRRRFRFLSSVLFLAVACSHSDTCTSCHPSQGRKVPALNHRRSKMFRAPLAEPDPRSSFFFQHNRWIGDSEQNCLTAAPKLSFSVLVDIFSNFMRWNSYRPTFPSRIFAANDLPRSVNALSKIAIAGMPRYSEWLKFAHLRCLFRLDS